MNSYIAQSLSRDEMEDIRAFNLKVDTVMKDSVFLKIHRAYPTSVPEQSIYQLQRSISRLSEIKSHPFDCCVGSCICYHGPHSNLEVCPFCREPRFDNQGRPRKSFHYLPFIPRLQGMYRNSSLAQTLQTYRASPGNDRGVYNDIIDGQYYQDLCLRYVRINGREQSYTYFDDKHDIAIGISFDGFAPFKRRKQTCWPIMLINYNLPPTDRFKLVNLIPLGVIPGPSQPKDADSFLLPFVEEMLKLAAGVKSFDAFTKQPFILRAYCIAAFGDIPAAAKLMRMKGPNAMLPCRNCEIKGHRNPNSNSTTNYVSLSRPDGEDYRPNSLPLRTHSDIISQALEVSQAESKAAAERLSKEYGIKGIPVLSVLDSLRFPDTFPADFMHMVFENIIPELVDLWSGDYKGLDEGSGEYALPPSVLNAINEAILISGDTIPSSFGSRVPSLNDRYKFTAESWCHFAIHIAPTVLRGRFRKEKYYTHFMDLVHIIQVCIAYKISDEEIDSLETRLFHWVTTFER